MTIDQTLKSFTETLHPLEVKLIRAFLDSVELDDEGLSLKSGLDSAKVRTAVEWLKAKEVLRIVSSSSVSLVSLTELGERVAIYGTPEMIVLNLLRRVGSIQISEIAPCLEQLCLEQPAAAEEGSHTAIGITPEEVQPACGALRAEGLVTFQEGGVVVLSEAGKDDDRLQTRQNFLAKIKNGSCIALSELSDVEKDQLYSSSKKRGKAKGYFRIDEKKTTVFALTEFGKQVYSCLGELGITGEEIQELTPEIIADGSWRTRGFRKFNTNLKPTRFVVGKYHSYRQYVDFLKSRMIALGFQEMVGSVVETEFWDMDALFMPQFHSAREIHDVYFLKEPKYAREIPEPFLSNVALAHEQGAVSGRRGWGYTFDKQKCRRLILRSQTTALSARTLANSPQVPGKYFSIARCFRYDQVDASHAPDFFQVEGIVIDGNANLKSLLGLLEIFAREIAMAKEIKFVPAYFPFTEPSVEVHMRHEKLGWLELGGAGIFRPEVCEPLGVSERVLAWGLGTDRMAMVALGVNDIRDLCSSDLEFLRSSRVTGVL